MGQIAARTAEQFVGILWDDVSEGGGCHSWNPDNHNYSSRPSTNEQI